MEVLQILEIAQEERDEEVERIRRQGLRALRDRTNPLEIYDGNQFLQRFRISKETFLELLGLLTPELQRPTRRCKALSPAIQLAIALRFYATGSFQLVIGDTCNVSQASCCRVIHRVTDAICNRKRHFTKFPHTHGERREVMVGFNNIQDFPELLVPLMAAMLEFRTLGDPIQCGMLTGKATTV